MPAMVKVCARAPASVSTEKKLNNHLLKQVGFEIAD